MALDIAARILAASAFEREKARTMNHGVLLLWLLQSQFFTHRERPAVNRRANQRSTAGFFRPVYRPLLLSPAL
jgi:hypothetical protein